MTRREVIVILFLWLSLGIKAYGSESPFAVVFIDSKTEEKYGAFPLERSILAKGVEQIKRLKAKGIVLKFFLDLPRNIESDKKLARAFVGLPVLIEARLDDSEKHPNRLPDRFFLTNSLAAGDGTLSAQSGWIPLEIFSAEACDIGFVDLSTPNRVPILEKYRGRYVKSLYLCALELALGERAQILPGQSVTIKGQAIPMDGKNQVAIEFPAKDEIEYVPFHELLSGGIEPKRLEGKVVILGYDGTMIHSLDTPLGKIRAHRAFFYGLESLYKKSTGDKRLLQRTKPDVSLRRPEMQ